MISRPLYSVIVSAYKNTASDTIAACADLSPPGDRQFEIIVADNSPDARFLEDAEKLRRQCCAAIRHVHLSRPGKTAVQNRAIAKAEGEVIIFLDDDVLPDTTLIMEYERAFDRHSAAGAVQGRIELLFEDGAKVPLWVDDRFRLDLAEMNFEREIFPFEMALTGANMAVRRTMFERYGLFDERLGPGRSGTLEDEEFSRRIRAGGEKQLFWPSARVLHRIPPQRLTVSSFARLYRGIGASECYVSAQLVKRGMFGFSLYTARMCLKDLCGMASALIQCHWKEAVHHYCNLNFYWGWWKERASWKNMP